MLQFRGSDTVNMNLHLRLYMFVVNVEKEHVPLLVCVFGPRAPLCAKLRAKLSCRVEVYLGTTWVHGDGVKALIFDKRKKNPKQQNQQMISVSTAVQHVLNMQL